MADFDDMAHGGDPSDYGDRDPDDFAPRARRTLECRFCGANITFSNRIPYGEDGREHRCLRPTGGTSSYACNRCKAPISFKDRRPINPNGTPHRCIAEARAANRPAPKAAPKCDPDTGELFEF